MNGPPTQRSGARHTPRQPAANNSSAEGTTLLRHDVVTAVGYPPAGRRTKFHTVVPECVFCGGAHVHRGTANGPAQGTYRAGCGRGIYWIAVLIVPMQRTGGAP